MYDSLLDEEVDAENTQVFSSDSVTIRRLLMV